MTRCLVDTGCPYSHLDFEVAARAANGDLVEQRDRDRLHALLVRLGDHGGRRCWRGRGRCWPMFSQDYLRGVDDALAEVRRRLIVAGDLGERLSEYGMQRILDDTSVRLHSGDLIAREET